MKNFTFLGKNIIPEEFNYIGYCFYFSFESEDGSMDHDCDFDYPEEYHDIIDPQVGLLANQEAQCNCCNQRIKRGNFFQDQDGNIFITGTNCGSSILKFSQSVKYSKSITLEKRKKLERIRIISETFSKYPQLEEDFEVYHKIIKEIREKFFKWLKISEKQVSFIHRLAEQRRAFEKSAVKAVGGEKMEINDLEIISVKFSSERLKISRYSSSDFLKTTAKITLKHPDGWLIFGNLKTSEYFGSGYKDEKFQKQINEDYPKGSKVNAKFSKIIVSDRDPFFSFGKRIRISK